MQTRTLEYPGGLHYIYDCDEGHDGHCAVKSTDGKCVFRGG
jgi:hypothetical protein